MDFEWPTVMVGIVAYGDQILRYIWILKQFQNLFWLNILTIQLAAIPDTAHNTLQGRNHSHMFWIIK